MDILGIALIIIIITLLIEIIYSPRLDTTKENNLLLWYGNPNRKYLKLW